MEIDEQEYYVKPMNCPFHIMMYKSKMRSYRDLPLRWAELGTVYRYEKSGVLHGLLRVRGFTQDDAHIICRPDQMPDEIRERSALLPVHAQIVRIRKIQGVPGDPVRRKMPWATKQNGTTRPPRLTRR